MITVSKYLIYILAFTFANLLVVWFGPYGLIISSLLLVPFDFIMRCLFHETQKGIKLLLSLTTLVLLSSVVTVYINHDSFNIALASCLGFTGAQIGAGIFYQLMIKQKYFIKVNGSDLIAIIVDSIIFQIIAFSEIDTTVFLSQVLMKFIGGLFWYYIIFVKFKLQTKW